MRLPTAVFAFVLVLPFCALGAPVPKEAEKPVYYFPTKVGDKWVYEHTDTVRDEKVEEERAVVSVEDKNGIKVVITGRFIDGKLCPENTQEVSAKGLFYSTSFFVKPRFALKLPHMDGQSWENKDLKQTLTAYGPEEVKVPAGTYQAIRVEEYAHGDPKDRILRTYWYAPRVGIVKAKLLNGLAIVVLKSFTPGKD